VVRAKLAKTYRQGLILCAVTFHFSHSRPVKGEAYSSIREGEATSL
jgi:hypothetical protein